MNNYTIGTAQPQPPIHLCRLRGGDYEYLTGYDGDAVVIRECPKKKTLEGDWENGRTICCEERERTQEVFTLCALLNFFTDEIQFFNDANFDNETVDKALSKFVSENCCRPSNLLIQIEPCQEFYMTEESLHIATGGKHKLFRDYANDDTGKESANHEAK